VLLVAALATACATPLMDMKFSLPPNKNAIQFEQDRYECLQRHDDRGLFQACVQARAV
jgi:hypothetical protein